MNDSADPQMNVDELYREEAVTDRRIGTIRILYPIKPDGSDDATRETIFVGAAQMMTPGGALPLNFEIEAKTLSEAAAGFSQAAQKAMEETMEELQKMRRDAASSIVIPGQEGGGAPGGGIKIP
jgi:hypothetical protein